jgi:uracil-DNA glycosylase
LVLLNKVYGYKPTPNKYAQAETVSKSWFIEDHQRRPWPKRVMALGSLKKGGLLSPNSHH